MATRRVDTILSRSYVADWRATDHAWITSTAALYLLPDVVPAVAADDALKTAHKLALERLKATVADPRDIAQALQDLDSTGESRVPTVTAR